MVDIPHTSLRSAPYATCGHYKILHLQSITESFKNTFYQSNKAMELSTWSSDKIIDNLKNIVNEIN